MRASQSIINALKEVKQVKRKKVACGGKRSL